MDIVDKLQGIGLSEGEAKVYLALLSLGKSTVGPITKKAGVSPSKVYNVLDRLIKKGVVSYIIEGKTRYYRVLEPKQLHSFLEQKRANINKELDAQEKDLNCFLPDLMQIHTELKEKESAEIFEGIRGIKTLFEMALQECKKGDAVKVVGYPKIASQLLDGYFKEYNKKRAKIGFGAEVIFDYDAWFCKKREKRKYAHYRYLPKGMTTPAFICIFKDVVGTIILSERQKLCFVIRNKEVSNSYEQYFKLMWDAAVCVG